MGVALIISLDRHVALVISLVLLPLLFRNMPERCADLHVGLQGSEDVEPERGAPPLRRAHVRDQRIRERALDPLRKAPLCPLEPVEHLLRDLRAALLRDAVARHRLLRALVLASSLLLGRGGALQLLLPLLLQ